MLELRAIIIDSPEGVRRVRLFIRGERGDDYRTFEYPSSKKLTRGAIEKFLAKETGVGVKEIAIAHHVKIPEGE